jgi:hypothetical protein
VAFLLAILPSCGAQSDETLSDSRPSAPTRFSRPPVELDGVRSATPVPADEWTDTERALLTITANRAVVVDASASTLRILYRANNCFGLPTAVAAGRGGGKIVSIVLDETKSCPEFVEDILINHVIDLELEPPLAPQQAVLETTYKHR